MFQFTLSAHVRRLTGLFAVVSLLGAALGTAQPMAASAPHAPAQDTGGYALPLSRQIVPRDQFDDPHHDYPAIDIEVPIGTPVYVVKRGTVNNFYQADGCGKGVQITAVDGAVYTYCHLNSYSKTNGAEALTGGLLGYSGNTGRSSGPHLHLQIKVNGVKRCPQNMLLAIYDQTPAPAPSTLPTSGCTY